MRHNTHQQPYLRLLFMVAVSFISMYILMYAMVNSLSDVFPNHNQLYMAGLMTMPMVIIELLLMGVMYPNKTRNRVIIVSSVAIGILCFAAIRNQTLVDDTQFVKSMIPHHSSAVLMCTNASLHDKELQTLCANITAGQQREIEKMRAVLNRLEH